MGSSNTKILIALITIVLCLVIATPLIIIAKTFVAVLFAMLLYACAAFLSIALISAKPNNLTVVTADNAPIYEASVMSQVNSRGRKQLAIRSWFDEAGMLHSIIVVTVNNITVHKSNNLHLAETYYNSTSTGSLSPHPTR